MANKEKTTKREFFTAIGMIMEQNQDATVKVGEREITAAAIMGFVADSLEALNRKTNKKSDEQIAADTALKNEIMNILMESDKPMTVTEVLNAKLSSWMDTIGEVPSNQKLTRKLNDLVGEGEVTKTTEKGRSFFSVA